MHQETVSFGQPQAESQQAAGHTQQFASAPQTSAGYTQQQPQMPAQATNAYSQQQAQAYQERVYQAYAAQSAPQHVKTGASSKKSLGKTFGVSFSGAALAVVLGLGYFGYQAVTDGLRVPARAGFIGQHEHRRQTPMRRLPKRLRTRRFLPS
ncbi:MAG: hypothetical protein ACLRX5_07800 [Slackia sp.]